MEQQEQASSSTQHNIFHKWINLQQQDLSELLQSLNSTDNTDRDNSLSQLIEKNIQHFKDYIEERSQLGRDQACDFFAPSWCSSLENSLLWMAGCRPSLFIRLIYALTGSEFESQLGEFLRTGDKTALASGLSPSQLTSVDNLHMKTIKEEDKLTSRFASLQQEMVGQPLAVIARRVSPLGELDDDTGKALDDVEKSMASVLEEADKLRINILKEVIDILTPLQAVDFLATGKKLHLCVHEWGKKRDEKRKEVTH